MRLASILVVALDMARTLTRYVVRRSSFVVRRSPFSRTNGVHGSHSYNAQLPQSALDSKTPLQAMKDWHKLKPELFRKNPYYLTGCDT